MRLPLGLVVEGDCEYEGFPSIISKLNNNLGYVPISNARGIGNIVKNLDKELLLLIKLHSPLNIIITLDLREAIRSGIAANCLELKENVTNQCSDFMNRYAQSGLCLPERIIVVIVDKTYETWLLADKEALIESGYFKNELEEVVVVDVDQSVPNPSKILSDHVKKEYKIKGKSLRKKLGSLIRPEVAEISSRSFRKFSKEVRSI